MTLPEAANKIAVALQGSPLLIGLLLLNVGILGMVTYLTMKGSEMRSRERTDLIHLIERCVLGSKYQLQSENPVPPP